MFSVNQHLDFLYVRHNYGSLTHWDMASHIQSPGLIIVFQIWLSTGAGTHIYILYSMGHNTVIDPVGKIGLTLNVLMKPSTVHFGRELYVVFYDKFSHLPVFCLYLLSAF